MIEIQTKPTAKLNVSKISISLNSAAEFSSGAARTAWGKTPGQTDSEYIGNLALAQLGLTRDETVVAVEPEAAPAEPAAE